MDRCNIKLILSITAEIHKVCSHEGKPTAPGDL